MGLSSGRLNKAMSVFGWKIEKYLSTVEETKLLQKCGLAAKVRLIARFERDFVNEKTERSMFAG